jgi:hypothetical protein
MHFIISCEIRTIDSAKRRRIRSQLRDALASYSWVMPLDLFYIVRIRSEMDRFVIVEQLKQICRATGLVRFVASPPMRGGQYRGWLPKDMWTKIKKRSKADA